MIRASKSLDAVLTARLVYSKRLRRKGKPMLSKEDQLKKPPKKPRARKCLSCREYFKPKEQGITTCSTECAILHSKSNFTKQKVREKRKAKKELHDNDRSALTKKAQGVFNKYIRLRDKAEPCISCGHTGRRQRHAGHFRPVGRNHQLRFNEDNCHSQCSICNNHLSGNLVPYREALITKIGEDKVIALEEDNETKSYSVQELREIIETYNQKIKEMI